MCEHKQQSLPFLYSSLFLLSKMNFAGQVHLTFLHIFFFFQHSNILFCHDHNNILSNVSEIGHADLSVCGCLKSRLHFIYLETHLLVERKHFFIFFFLPPAMELKVHFLFSPLLNTFNRNRRSICV